MPLMLMASMILGWTLNDVTTAMGLGATDHLLHLRGDALKDTLRDLVKAIKEGVDLGEDIEVWHMAQQDSYIDLQDPIVIGAPMMFGARCPRCCGTSHPTSTWTACRRPPRSPASSL